MATKQIAAIVALSFLLVTMLLYPGFYFSPGDLNKKHASIKNCGACHTAFTKPGGVTCVVEGCHDSTYWEAKKGFYIGHLQKERCLVCHTEHTGVDGSITAVKAHEGKITGGCVDCHRMTKKHIKTVSARCDDCHLLAGWRPAKFDHAGLDDTRKCRECHKPPDKHYDSAARCSLCHQTKGWKPATFDHRLLQKGDKCISCHPLPKKHIATKGDCYLCHQTTNWKVKRVDHTSLAKSVKCAACHPLPSNHFLTDKECSFCHTSEKWTPANFAHTFPIQHEAGRTKNRCETCHPKSLDSYDCYSGCHEHTARNVRSEHLEEGIRDYSNCVKCHPTGREDEAKGRDRKKRGWKDRFWREKDEDDDDDD